MCVLGADVHAHEDSDGDVSAPNRDPESDAICDHADTDSDRNPDLSARASAAGVRDGREPDVLRVSVRVRL